MSADHAAAARLSAAMQRESKFAADRNLALAYAEAVKALRAHRDALTLNEMTKAHMQTSAILSQLPPEE